MNIYEKLIERFGEVKASIEFRKEGENIVIIVSFPSPTRFRWWPDPEEGFCDHFYFPCGCQLVCEGYLPCEEHLLSPIE